MNKFKKPIIFVAALLATTILNTYITYAESPAPGQPAASGTQFKEKYDLITFQTGSQFANVMGKKIKFDVIPSGTDKKLFIPAKFISDALGLKFEYNPKSKLITFAKKESLVVYQLNSNTAFINGKKVLLNTPPVLIKGSPMVPVKAVVESFGAKYEWDEKTKTASVKIPRKIISFQDIYLEISVRLNIKKLSGDIYLEDVEAIRSLALNDPKITSLKGLQYFAGLTDLKINNSMVSDISPLSGLKNLQSLDLSGNRIRNLEPLSSLENLQQLDLSDNPVADAAPVFKLNKLVSIKLWESQSLGEIVDIDNTAKKIISDVIKPGMSDFEKELALHDYLIIHTKYDRENYYNNSIPEIDHTAYGTLVKKLAVCDGYAKAMQILLGMCGIEAYVVIGDIVAPKEPGFENYIHAWNIVKINGFYYHLDPTFDDPISIDNNTAEKLTKDTLVHKYFNLSDKQMALSHKWDRSKYPVCKIDSELFNNNLQQEKDTIITESYIYRIYNDKLYKFLPGGSDMKILTNDSLRYITLSKDYIFYLNLDEGSSIYRIKTDGTERQKVVSDYALYPVVYGDYLYYIDKNKGTLVKCMQDGSNSTQFNEKSYSSYFNIYNDWIFFRSFSLSSSSKLYKTKIDLSEKKVVIDEPLLGFDLSSDSRDLTLIYGSYEEYSKEWIYYISKSNGNNIYKIKNDGTEKTRLNEANSTEIEYFGTYIYYVNNTDKKYYRIRTDGTGTPETF